jgi:hypothetical protein
MRKPGIFVAASLVALAGAGGLFAQLAQQPTPVRRPPPVLGGDPRRIIDPPTTMPPPGEPLARRSPNPLAAGRPASGDGASVDSILAALYESVSHDSDREPDWNRMRDIFLPVGMFIPPKPARDEIFTVLDVDGFRQRVQKAMAAAKQRGEATAFFEKEVARRTDCFGNVCQIFSTYEARRAPSDEKPFVSGINSIQLVGDGQRWWVASIVWDTERPGNPIPEQYRAK